jgi:peptidoglycan/xylan/chitin deacetylase (PgdA/CDA1 family)
MYVLCYHRFGDNVSDGTTIKTARFEQQIKYIQEKGYTIIPMSQFLDWKLGNGTVPNKAVVITIDDGHASVYANAYPIIKKYKVPVTLFIYPSAISNASYAMTWEQLVNMKANGADIQSHTYWHPNFKTEKKRNTKEEYQKIVTTQLKKSKEKLNEKLSLNITALAWPFGIYDKFLQQESRKYYSAAFSIEERTVTKQDDNTHIPRYMITHQSNLANILK